MKTIKFKYWYELPNNFTGIAEYPNGTKEYYVDGKLHRIDGPAIEWYNGTKEYYANGKLHRLDGPVIECLDGTKHYYVDGKRHRLDGPAREYYDGLKEYFINDKQVTQEAQQLLYNLMKLKGMIKE